MAGSFMAELKEADVRRIIEESTEKAIEKAILRTLTAFGISVDNPQEMQADMQHVRRHRKVCEAIKNKIINSAIGIMVTALLAGLWIVFKQELTK